MTKIKKNATSVIGYWQARKDAEEMRSPAALGPGMSAGAWPVRFIRSTCCPGGTYSDFGGVVFRLTWEAPWQLVVISGAERRLCRWHCRLGKATRCFLCRLGVRSDVILW